MKHSIYLEAKKLVKNEAKRLKAENDDKPYIRYELNSLNDQMCRQFSFYAMKETISEKVAAMYSNWLSSFTASVHPA